MKKLGKLLTDLARKISEDWKISVVVKGILIRQKDVNELMLLFR